LNRPSPLDDVKAWVEKSKKQNAEHREFWRRRLPDYDHHLERWERRCHPLRGLIHPRGQIWQKIQCLEDDAQRTAAEKAFDLRMQADRRVDQQLQERKKKLDLSLLSATHYLESVRELILLEKNRGATETDEEKGALGFLARFMENEKPVPSILHSLVEFSDKYGFPDAAVSDELKALKEAGFDLDAALELRIKDIAQQVRKLEENPQLDEDARDYLTARLRQQQPAYSRWFDVLEEFGAQLLEWTTKQSEVYNKCIDAIEKHKQEIVDAQAEFPDMTYEDYLNKLPNAEQVRAEIWDDIYKGRWNTNVSRKEYDEAVLPDWSKTTHHH